MTILTTMADSGIIRHRPQSMIISTIMVYFLIVSLGSCTDDIIGNGPSPATIETITMLNISSNTPHDTLTTNSTVGLSNTTHPTNNNVITTDTTSTPTNHPLGSNALCGDGSPRIRKDWDLLSDEEKNFFLDAVELAIARGLYQPFIRFHADTNTTIYSHDTCAFAFWHRRFALAMENMLRSLDFPKYACLTLPYWNIMEHFRDQRRGLCSSFGSCARVVLDVGGKRVSTEETREYDNHEAEGGLLTGRPLHGLVDSKGRRGIVRSDSILEDEIPLSCSYEKVQRLYSIDNFALFARKLQKTIHDDVHDTIGGFMPTYSSPADPLFYIWHSTIDLFLYMWESCHLDPVATKIPPQAPFYPAPLWAFYDSNQDCMHTDEALDTFGTVRATDDFYIKNLDRDIRDDPLIGRYFQQHASFADMALVRNLRDNEFTYTQLTQPLWDTLLDPEICPYAGSWTVAPTITPPVPPPTPSLNLNALAEYLNQARETLHFGLPPSESQHLTAYMGYLQCHVQGMEHELPDESFLRKMMNGQVDKKGDTRCGFFLPEGYGEEQLELLETSMEIEEEQQENGINDNEVVVVINSNNTPQENNHNNYKVSIPVNNTTITISTPQDNSEVSTGRLLSVDVMVTFILALVLIVVQLYRVRLSGMKEFLYSPVSTEAPTIG